MEPIQKNQNNSGLQPGLQPGATQDPGEEGFPWPETPHAGRPRVPDFFHFFDFFRFFAFSKKIKKMKKIKKIQGAPAGRVKGSSQGSSLEPPGRPRVPDFFIFLIFFFFFGLFEKNQKNLKIFIDFF